MKNYNIPQMEKRFIVEALIRTGNKPKKAAELLGINERTLYRKRNEHNIISMEIKKLIQERKKSNR